jgi:cyclophilin family peptidyl-prolyl cis-trans isomerase
MNSNKSITHAVSLTFFLFLGLAYTQIQASEYLMCTDLGPIELSIYQNESPIHADNFRQYVEEEFFTGLIFHRVVSNFVVQTGGYNRQLGTRLDRPPIPIESANGLANARGTIAAARTNNPNSASSQFFINLSDNVSLNPRRRNLGYTVFGEITSGMELIDLIGSLPTGAIGPLESEVPSPMIAIRSIFPKASIDLSLTNLNDAELASLFGQLTDEKKYKEANDLLNSQLADCGDINSLYLILKAHIYIAINNNEQAMRYLEEYFWFADTQDAYFLEAQTIYNRISLANGDLATAPINEMLATTMASCSVPYPPIMPNGQNSILLDMQFARSAVLGFSQKMEDLADCIEDAQDERGLSTEEVALLESAYYRTIAINEAMQRRLNYEIQAFSVSQN